MWQIFYGDGTAYSDRDGSPANAPCLNVQVIVQDNPDATHGRTTIHHKDYYVWIEETKSWDDRDLFGVWDYLFSIPGQKVVKAGRTIPNDNFGAIYENAMRLVRGLADD